MKNLTEFATKTVLDLLIHTNGKTSTLDVKNTLRSLDYDAKQSDVREKIENIFDNNLDSKYDRVLSADKSHYEYSFEEDFIDENNEFECATDKKVTFTPSKSLDFISKNDPITTGYLSNNTQAFTTKHTTIVAPVLKDTSPSLTTLAAIKLTDDREPIMIFYTENHARKSATNPQNWIVYHKDGNKEIQIFDKNQTRDKVRSRYSSILKCKIQDVRACKFMNY